MKSPLLLTFCTLAMSVCTADAIPIQGSADGANTGSFTTGSIVENGVFNGIDRQIERLELTVISGGTFENGFVNLTPASWTSSFSGGTAVASGPALPLSQDVAYRLHFSDSLPLATDITLDYRAFANGQWVGFGTLVIGTGGNFQSFTEHTIPVSTPDGGSTSALLGLGIAGLAYARRKLA
jgi:hypothetical protein